MVLVLVVLILVVGILILVLRVLVLIPVIGRPVVLVVLKVGRDGLIHELGRLGEKLPCRGTAEEARFGFRRRGLVVWPGRGRRSGVGREGAKARLRRTRHGRGVARREGRRCRRRLRLELLASVDVGRLWDRGRHVVARELLLEGSRVGADTIWRVRILRRGWAQGQWHAGWVW